MVSVFHLQLVFRPEGPAMSMLSEEMILTPGAYQGFFDHAKCEFLTGIRDELMRVIETNLAPGRNWQFPRWREAICELPRIPDAQRFPEIRDGRVCVDGDADDEILKKALRALMPWRKGPWEFFGIHLDCEWLSDWKWDRVSPHIDDLRGRRIMDIGCGNGYHLWRMASAGADAVVGIEPHLLNVAQFSVMQRWFPDLALAVLPMSLEEYPVNTRIYDTVFSMGVLYHRKSPADHLLHCKSSLREGGQLVLETLVVPGDANTVLVPEERYGKMRNVWYLPSADHMIRLLRRTGFREPRLVDMTVTSTDEQRRTDWMEFESLADFLDPRNPSLTIEGYPAPTRATFVAAAP
jgi:tRNA (mo5U34)-methyltransferase